MKRKTAASTPPNGSFLPRPPRGVAEYRTEALATAEKTAFPFPKAVTASILSALLGVSQRRIRQLAESGVLPRAGRGTYAFPESVSAFCDYQRRHLDDDSEKRFREARAKLTETRQRREQLALDLLEGRSLSATQAKVLWCEILATAKSRLLAVPSRVAPMLADQSKTAQCFETVQDAIYEALADLATPDTLKTIHENYLASIKAEAPAQQIPEDEDL